MKQNYNEILREYRIYLTEHEKSHATIQKYVRELVWFLHFYRGKNLQKQRCWNIESNCNRATMPAP